MMIITYVISKGAHIVVEVCYFSLALVATGLTKGERDGDPKKSVRCCSSNFAATSIPGTLSFIMNKV